MKQQTATEWLFEQLWDEPRDKFTWYAILSKAEEMMEGQICNAYVDGLEGPYIGAEEYYNKTYNNENSNGTSIS